MPFAKVRLEVSEGWLGLLLLGCGAMAMMPLSGILIARYGSHRMMLLGVIIIAQTLPVLAWSSSIVIISVALFLFGGGVGMLDVSMNTHGILVQNLYPKPIFSVLHALLNIGSRLLVLFLSHFPSD